MSSLMDKISKGGYSVNFIHVDKLCDFRNHPFSMNEDSDDFRDLYNSIADNGVLCPCFVRPVEGSTDEFEILSGHRRTKVCSELGIDVPCYVVDADDFEAAVIMTHTNTTVREKILPSEKAKAYALCMDLAKHQGIEGDDTAEIIGGEEDSRRNVYRYIRLSKLNDGLLDYVDSYDIRTSTGVELSYLDNEAQENLIDYMRDNESVPLLDDAKELRRLYEENGNSLSYDDISVYFNGTDDQKPKKKSKKGLSIKREKLNEFFDENMDIEDIERIVFVMFEKYHNGYFEI